MDIAKKIASFLWNVHRRHWAAACSFPNAATPTAVNDTEGVRWLFGNGLQAWGRNLRQALVVTIAYLKLFPPPAAHKWDAA
jgi:hypothetical protein